MLRIEGLAMAVAIRLRIKALGELVLRFGRGVCLVLKDEDGVFVESIADGIPICGREIVDV